MTTTDAIDAPTLPALMAQTLGDLVEGVAVLHRMQASIGARIAELVDQAREWSEVGESLSTGAASEWGPQERARRSLVAELAVALRMPERSVEALVAESRALVHDLPATLEALAGGRITERHAQVMVDHATSLAASARGTFEEAALTHAERLTPRAFDRAARRMRERMHPESIDSRQRVAAEQRSVAVEPARDGMGWLTAYLPATAAYGIDDHLTEIARARQRAGDPRTLTPLRADILAELLLGGDDAESIRAQILVTVPALTLLGRSDEPAILEGYGPIDIETARGLAGGAAGWMRILTHPETGAVLSVGRDRYRAPADLRLALRVRDETCRFPTCTRPARRTDLDHTRDWAHEGVTAIDNLAHLCRHHHRLKHQTGWSVTQAQGGTLEWVSPWGRRASTHPAHAMAPPE